MRAFRYVTLDPTGNTTCLVLDPVEKADEKSLTRELLKECEQVAYLEAPSAPGAAAAIRLMGGEFCGNAAMASAAWLVRNEPGQGGPVAFLLEVSGAREPVLCTVQKAEGGFEGTVEMPGVPEISRENFFGVPLTLVRIEGIAHLIYEGEPMADCAAEELLKKIAGVLPDEAAGLLQWNRETGVMRPLVYVRGSGSLVWEHGCGSGSAAVGALESLRAGDGRRVTPVEQPGGVIRAAAEAENGKIVSVEITGKIRFGQQSVIEIP